MFPPGEKCLKKERKEKNLELRLNKKYTNLKLLKNKTKQK